MFELKYSTGNRKLGTMCSVSLPPIITCAKGMPCAESGQCYALKYCKYRPSCQQAYIKNYELYQRDPDKYFSELGALMIVNNLLRMHTSGDIPDEEYLDRLNLECKNHQQCTVLCYTKKFSLVNNYLREHEKARNLILVFSEWLDILKAPNPYSLPVARTIIKSDDACVNEFICNNDCRACQYHCWNLNSGDRVAFIMH